MPRTDGKERLIKVIWHSFIRVFCVVAIALLWRVRIYGRKNVPKKGPVLVLSSHQSYLDPFFAQSYLLRHFHFIARETLWDNKIVGPLMNSLFTIPIKQGEADIAAMRKVITKLKADSVVCLFPEGTRTFNGKITEVKPGFALLSRKGNAQIVPTVIDGAFECWPRSQKFPKFRKIAVMYGEVITPEQVKELGDREFAKVLTQKLRQMQKELRKKLGKEPFDYSEDIEPVREESLAE